MFLANVKRSICVGCMRRYRLQDYDSVILYRNTPVYHLNASFLASGVCLADCLLRIDFFLKGGF